MPNISSSLSNTSNTDITVGTGAVDNISIPTASTEVSHVLPAGTKRFVLQCRAKTLVQLSFTATESGTKYYSIWPGNIFSGEVVKPSSTVTLYLQTPKTSQTVEIITWS